MRRWHGCGTLAVACRPHRQCKGPVVFPQARLASTATSGNDRTSYYQRYAVFQKTTVPKSGRIEEWAALLDGALPPHLRDQNVSPPLLTLAATDLAEILLAAQGTVSRKARQGPAGLEYIEPGHDLLYFLGFKQGRWNAVVWLIKKLVDRFPIPQQPDATITNALSLWNQVPPLLNREHSPLQLARVTENPGPTPTQTRTLVELTGSPDDDAKNDKELAHDVLGQVWRTLGTMTQACAGGSIRQEVLEIIAYLHHREIMPMSIYQYQPTMDESAIRQSPLIPLLSSRILTSLSDAAWRAHEKLVVEETRARQGDRAYPGALAAPYRARIDGISSEVWLELILWSCLHGGWVQQGGYILDSIVGREDWKPLSWREYEKTLSPQKHLNHDDWNAWDYMFRTRAAKSMDPPSEPIPDVQRTVSAEVVNAYIDAIASLPSKYGVVSKLSKLNGFLAKASLGLTTGSWDALAMRLIDNDSLPTDVLIRRVVKISPGLGQGLTSKNMQDLPAYVLDGGLAMQGVLNGVLHRAVLSGSLKTASKVLKDMLLRADRDKLTSLTSFMEGSKPLLRTLDGNDMFTSNVTGIEYPGFDLQIPTTTLALLLDLVEQSKDYELGRWLIYGNDVDEPIIRPKLYDDPFLAPALVRFAVTSSDKKLFERLRALDHFSLRFALDAQIEALRWDTAKAIVRASTDWKTELKTWSVKNLANLARVMLCQIHGAKAGQTSCQEHLRTAMELFSVMAKQPENTNTDFNIQIQTLLNVLSSVDASWAQFCSGLRRLEGHHDFVLGTSAFNNLLLGVVTSYGSIAGRRLLRAYWPQSCRHRPLADSESMIDEHRGFERTRIAVVLPGLPGERKAVMYGTLLPNTRTITIILKKALEELRGLDSDQEPKQMKAGEVQDDEFEMEDDVERVDLTPHGMVAWAARRMAELPGYSDSFDVISYIETALHDVGMDDDREAVREIVRDATANIRADSMDDTDSDDTSLEGSNILMDYEGIHPKSGQFASERAWRDES